MLNNDQNEKHLMILFVMFICAVIFMMSKEHYANNSVLVTSNIDNTQYLVQNLPDKQEAANTIAIIRARIVKLLDYLNIHHTKDERTKRLNDRFDPNKIIESGNDSKYTSYSINKGEKLVLCIRSRDEHNKIVDPNLLSFVALHEVSHICTESVGHTEEFWDNFRWILTESIQCDCGIYMYEDYAKNPKKYCGMEVTDTPLTM